MTICVAVAVNDCIVLAADSASSLVQTNAITGVSQIINVYSHGEKVFNLHKGLPIAAMTCGMGNIGSSSIATLAKSLRVRLMSGSSDWKLDPKSYTMQEVAEKTRRYLFEERFQALSPTPAAPHSFEFWVADYSADSDVGHEAWKITLVNGVCDVAVQQIGGGGAGMLWGGQPAAIHRLVFGVDPAVYDEMVGASVDATSASALMAHLRAKLEVPFAMPTMLVRDAIDLADFLVETTKRFVRFLPGADTVGGDTNIAVVTRYEGFKWIRRKHYYPAHLNPLETGHVWAREGAHGQPHFRGAPHADLRISASRAGQLRGSVRREPLWRVISERREGGRSPQPEIRLA